GRRTADDCDVVAKLDDPSTRYCHVSEDLQTQVKFLGTYLVPKLDVQIAATYRGLPGPSITASYFAGNSVVAPSLGRNLSSSFTTTVPLVEPGTMYSDSTHLLDVRFGKVLRFGRY